MIETLKYWDEELFLVLNSLHMDWLDPVMYVISGTLLWLPLYAFLIFLIIKNQGKGSIWVFIGIALAILFSDQATSGLMKPYFERLRPCQDPRWEGLMYNFRHCGGMYGFASSHAANTFSLATYMLVTFHRKVKGFGWLFFWAAIVSYSRIYLGVHYPGDVLVGAFVGMLCGVLAWWITVKVKMTLIRSVEEMDE